MAQRTIHWLHLDVDILNDEKIDVIRSMPEGDSMFIVWIGLLCLAMKCCDGGYLYVTQGIPYTPSHLARIFKVGKSIVDKAIQAFEGLGMLSTHDGTAIEIINFEKHQGVNALERLREVSRKSSVKYRAKQKQQLPENKIESKTKSVTVTSPDNVVYEEGFKRFWSIYPRKVKKPDAERAWVKLKADEELTNRIIEGVKKYKQTEDWKKETGKFIPYPASFLNSRRWEDEIDVKPERENPFE